MKNSYVLFKENILLSLALFTINLKPLTSNLSITWQLFVIKH